MHFLQPIPESSSDLEEGVDLPHAHNPWSCNRGQNILVLNAGFLGLQGVFTVLFGSATAYLKSLGLGGWLISLSWLAGPIAGALFQPYVGVWSDNCSSSLGKRRPFIIAGTVLIILSLIGTARAKQIVTLFSLSSGSTSESHIGLVIFVEICIWILNFAIQPVQLGLRSLIVDLVPQEQQHEANAWAARFTLGGNILGYCLGSVDLPRHLPFLGRTQFQALSSLVSINLLLCTSITCYFIKEQKSGVHDSSYHPTTARSGIRDLWKTLRTLPSSTRTVCFAQFFSWLGWFPFLFYASSYVGALKRQDLSIGSQGVSPRWEESARAGSLAMSVFALSSFVMGLVLPQVVELSSRFESSLSLKSSWRWNPELFTLRRIWLAGQVIFAGSMLLTFFKRISVAYIIVGAIGFSWATSAWIPYAIIGTDIQRQIQQAECTEMNDEGAGVVAKVMGIHNISIASPQIISALACSLFFWLMGNDHAGEVDATTYALLLSIAGSAAIASAWVIRDLPEESYHQM
ncbi:major facilitator superfamily domain-containing protein [Aspergillus alliaceus]|uniref:major facilitator superfamily domain-containing protein n=1 Tax=Petromyces alliaceus TaxID=209559 RepID=UPI0012A415BA|nr:major facilitator superfamily domain-containing protein [Aspergillus alliaceus]KAB8237449.1 major facilitator superfamily domain-containing protein [Aspergillus alliaceus]